MYASEIWRWEKIQNIEKLQIKYAETTLNLDNKTSLPHNIWDKKEKVVTRERKKRHKIRRQFNEKKKIRKTKLNIKIKQKYDQNRTEENISVTNTQ